LSLRFKIFEVTLSGFAGGEYLPLPTEFGYCGYAVLQCCGLKDGISLRDNGALPNAFNVFKCQMTKERGSSRR